MEKHGKFVDVATIMERCPVVKSLSGLLTVVQVMATQVTCQFHSVNVISRQSLMNME